jgi:hypothetical protein
MNFPERFKRHNQIIKVDPVSFAFDGGKIIPGGTPEYEEAKAKFEAAQTPGATDAGRGCDARELRAYVPLAEDGPGGPIGVYICPLCGQALGAADERCNSGIHEGPDSDYEKRPTAVLSTQFVAELRGATHLVAELRGIESIRSDVLNSANRDEDSREPGS